MLSLLPSQLGEDAYLSLVQRYRERVLSKDHPSTQRVRRIVQAILDANGLGCIEDEDESQSGGSALASASMSMSKSTSKSNSSLSPSRSRYDVERTHLPDGKDSDRRWRVAVVDNERMINSTASSGKSLFDFLFPFCQSTSRLIHRSHLFSFLFFLSPSNLLLLSPLSSRGVLWRATCTYRFMFLIGGIIVFTGLLSVCRNDDELAAVLGHGA